MASLKNTTINDTGYLKVASGTTGQRPGGASAGMLRWNTSDGNFEGYDGSEWLPLPLTNPPIPPGQQNYTSPGSYTKLTIDVMTDLSNSVASIVFHDAYQYFEERFNVKVLGAFTVNTDVMPGAEQLAEIREIIEHDKVACVFSEPQFNPNIINAVAKDMKIKTGVLDPLGATLDPGKDLYFNLIRNMSASFKGC